MDGLSPTHDDTAGRSYPTPSRDGHFTRRSAVLTGGHFNALRAHLAELGLVAAKAREGMHQRARVAWPVLAKGESYRAPTRSSNAALAAAT